MAQMTLAEAMKAAALTTSELARRVGVHKATISRLRRRIAKQPSYATLVMLERVLGLESGGLRWTRKRNVTSIAWERRK